MANKFWVNTGSATWDISTGNWAATSGGASGVAIPTAADDVFFDANSGTGTTTLSSSTIGRSINCTNFTGTISHPTALTVSIGDATAGASNVALKFVAGMTYTIADTTSAISFVTSSATQQTIDFGGKTIGNVTFAGLANTASWILSSAMTATGATWTLSRGILDLNGQTVNAGTFVGNSGNSHVLTFGASAVTITGGGTAWNTNTGSLTINPNTGTLTFTNATAMTVGAHTYPHVIFPNSANQGISVNGTPSFANITRTGTAAVSDSMTITGNITVTGTFTVTGNSLSNRILMSNVGGATVGTPRTITAAAVALTNVDFMDITGAGAATWSGSSVGDAGGNSGITFTTPLSLFGRGGSGSWSSTSLWSTSSGGAAGSTVPLPQDDVTLDANTTGTITMDMPRACKNLDMTNFTGTLTRGVVSSIYGSIIQGSGMTITGGGSDWRFDGRGSYTITSNGKTLNPFSMTSSFGGTYTLTDALVITGNTSISITNGTFSDGGFAVNIGSVTSGGAATRGITMLSGSTWILTAGNGTRWNVTATGFTLNSGTSTMKFTTSTTGTMSFAGAGLTYYNIWNATTASATMTITGNNTFNSIISDPGRTTSITAASNQTAKSLVNSNIAGAVPIFKSTSNGSPWTITDAGTMSVQYISLQDSTAAGGINFIASNSTNVSGNTNWTFTNAPFIQGISTIQGVSTITF